MGRRRIIEELKHLKSGTTEYRVAYNSLRAHGTIEKRPLLSNADKRLRQTLANINYRCTNKRDRHYQSYGGRGIKNFLTLDDLYFLWERDGATEMKQPSIDRKETSGHYTRENCRFIEMDVNRRRERIKASREFLRTKRLVDWAYRSPSTMAALLIAQANGLSAQLYPNRQRGAMAKFLEIGGRSCLVHTIRTWASHGSKRKYFDVHIVEQADFHIVVIRAKRFIGHVYIIPGSAVAGVRTVYIPVQRSFYGHLEPKTDWLQFRNAWHLLAAPKQSQEAA